MLLKYFYDDKLAHASYLVGCQATGEALVLDPGRDIDPYLHEAEAIELQIVAVTETHIHADFVSGARELAERTGARLYLSDEGGADWKYRFLEGTKHQLLKDGDIFSLGNIKLETMHTPGHTPEHISFILTDMGGGADKPMGIFTGDFVFVGSIGRPDLLEKAAGKEGTAYAGAQQMFDSLQRFKALPDYLQVWPGHGAGSACGKGLGAVPSSTVGYEKLFNPALRYENVSGFAEFLLADQPEPPRYFAVMKRVNREGPRLLRELPLPEHLPSTRLPALIEAGAMIVDTRDAEAFAGRHVAGTINIPGELLNTWAGWLVDYDQPVYLIADADEVNDYVRDLLYIGIDHVAGYFEVEALETLAEMGHQPQCYGVSTAERLSSQILDGHVDVIDVRNRTEWDEGRIPGANHVMLGYLAERASQLIDGRPIVVQCRTGSRSAIGASILKAAGAQEVINLQGGIRDWSAAGLPIES